MIARALLLLLALSTAGVAVAITRGHYDAADRERAILYARTARFGPTTKARIELWSHEVHPGRALRWEADAPGWFSQQTTVRFIAADAPPVPFHVDLAERRVEPIDAAGQALVETVRTWAAAPAAPK